MSAEKKPTVKDLVEKTFGKEASEDKDIVLMYEEILNDLVKKQIQLLRDKISNLELHYRRSPSGYLLNRLWDESEVLEILDSYINTPVKKDI